MLETITVISNPLAIHNRTLSSLARTNNVRKVAAAAAVTPLTSVRLTSVTSCWLWKTGRSLIGHCLSAPQLLSCSKEFWSPRCRLFLTRATKSSWFLTYTAVSCKSLIISTNERCLFDTLSSVGYLRVNESHLELKSCFWSFPYNTHMFSNSSTVTSLRSD